MVTTMAKKSGEKGSKPRDGMKRAQGTIRIYDDLVRMLAVIVAKEGGSVADLLDPQIRGWINSRYKLVSRKISEDASRLED